MPIGMTSLGGLEPSPRGARARAMKNCLSVIDAIWRLAERGAVGVSRDRWTRLQAAAHRLRRLLAEDLASASGESDVDPDVAADPCSVDALVRP